MHGSRGGHRRKLREPEATAMGRLVALARQSRRRATLRQPGRVRARLGSLHPSAGDGADATMSTSRSVTPMSRAQRSAIDGLRDQLSDGADARLRTAAERQFDFVGHPAEHCFTGSPGKPTNEVVKRHPLRRDERLVDGAQPRLHGPPVDVLGQALGEGDVRELLGPTSAVQRWATTRAPPLLEGHRRTAPAGCGREGPRPKAAALGFSATTG